MSRTARLAAWARVSAPCAPHSNCRVFTGSPRPAMSSLICLQITLYTVRSCAKQPRTPHKVIAADAKSRASVEIEPADTSCQQGCDKFAFDHRKEDEIMIHARDLTRNFKTKTGTVEAVRGLSLDVAEGELVAFLGPNGAGKSTSVRMLTTLLPPTSGTRSRRPRRRQRPAAVRRKIGYVGQGSGAGPVSQGARRTADPGRAQRMSAARRAQARRRADRHARTRRPREARSAPRCRAARSGGSMWRWG